jgi:tRNA threonylcarbamoyladenosine modification (KEOPS) complex Cgi121 subunit
MRSESDPSESGSYVTVYPFRVISGDLGSWLESFSLYFERGTILVVTSADCVFGPSHVSSAFFHALKAIENKRPRARDPSIEVLRWLTGSRQVQGALDVSRIKGKGSRMLLMTALKCSMCESPPRVILERWEGPGIEGLEMIEPEDENIWGGPEAGSCLGLGDYAEDGRLELAVLEKVASTDL